jgi:hypothetical protein
MEQETILKQCEILKNIIKTQTPETQAAGDQYILSTLNQLDDSGKIGLLKCLVQECLTKEECCQRAKNLKNNISPDLNKTKTDEERDTIDEYNQKELIRLKIWGIKLTIFLIFSVIVIIILLMIVLGSGAVHSTNALFDEIQAIYSYLFS